MKSTPRIYARLGFLICGITVMLGAFGSHILREMLPDSELEIFQTGAYYQFMHGLAIAAFATVHRKFSEKHLEYAILLFFTGIIFFSGSLYLLSTRGIWGDDSYNWIGALTPIGGAAFIIGWLLLFFKGFLPEEYAEPEGDMGKSKHKQHRRHRSSRKSKREKGSSDESTDPQS